MGLEAASRAAVESNPQALELALRLEAIGAMMALGQIEEIFQNMERAESLAAELNDQRARASVSTQTAVFLWMRGQFEQGLQHASQGLEASCLAHRRHMTMAARQARLMHLHALGRYSEADAECRILLAEHGPELAQHYVQSGWAAIPVINLYAFQASTQWRLGDSNSAQHICCQAYEILSKIDHPYSRLLVDTVQAQLWIEEGKLDQAEALLRAAAQQCVTHSVPTMLAVCVGALGNALARNRKAAEAVSLLEKGFADRIYEAAGPYAKTFMRIALGIAYRNVGRLDDAVRVGRTAVEQAVEEYGHRTEALYELGETLRRAGNLQGADECFTQTEEWAHRLGIAYYQKRAAARVKRHEDRRRA
jgi:tetratricopeptide (TPR) repeat protein